MENEEATQVYQVWGADGVVYGPVDLPALVTWVKAERVTAETWLYHSLYDRWQKANDLPELQIIFRSRQARDRGGNELDDLKSTADIGLKPNALRRIRVFANFSDEQLGKFMGYMEVFPAKQWNLIVKQGDPGDAMYLVLDGEARVRLMILSKESILTTLTSGDFFGEVSLFDHGPRSADVVANRDSLLLRMTAASFQRLVKEHPHLAAPFLQSICKTLTARIRADNKRFRESIRLLRVTNQYNNL